MTEKRALGPGAKCCGECDLCCCPPAADETPLFELGGELLDELVAEVKEEKKK